VSKETGICDKFIVKQIKVFEEEKNQDKNYAKVLRSLVKIG